MRFGIIVVFLCSLFLVGCESTPPTIALEDIDMSAADAGSGEKLFNQSTNGAPTCASCHMVEGSSRLIGPSLAGIATVAGNRINSQDDVTYLYWSIVRPSKYLAGGFSNLMYSGYDEIYTAEDIADLIAYLQTLQ